MRDHPTTLAAAAILGLAGLVTVGLISAGLYEARPTAAPKQAPRAIWEQITDAQPYTARLRTPEGWLVIVGIRDGGAAIVVSDINGTWLLPKVEER